MRRRIVTWALDWALAIAVVLLTTVGVYVATAPSLPQRVEIQGWVSGDDPTWLLPNNELPTKPLVAKISCNGTSTTTQSNGHYQLLVRPHSTYQCEASAPGYVAQAATLSGTAAVSLTLDFSVRGQAGCHANSPSDVECPELHVVMGKVTGTVTYTSSHQAVNGARVKCVGISPELTANHEPPSSFAVSDVQGHFEVPNLPVGDYGCIAQGATGTAARSVAHIANSTAVTLNVSLCDRGCGGVSYHDDRVMHAFTAYLIFWLPAGYVLEPGRGDSHMETAIERYFQDIGGTAYFSILTQYFDYAGHITNSATLGGESIDTTPYEHCQPAPGVCTAIAATETQPLVQEDIEAEVVRAVKANPGWKQGPDTEYFVFTGARAQACEGSGDLMRCTWKYADQGFCGYHNSSEGSSDSTGTPFIYAYIPDHVSVPNYCSRTRGATPSGDAALDNEIDSIAHEQFESMTDPFPGVSGTGGWYDDHLGMGSGEIGDRCNTDFAGRGADGATVTLNGHRYLLQAEWSNRIGGCAFQ